MDYQTYFERLEYILEAAEKGRIGSLGQLANHFECSERTIKRMIATLRSQGHAISYDRNVRRFVLQED